MTHVTCRLTAKNRDQLRNPTLGNRVWAAFTYFTFRDGLLDGAVVLGVVLHEVGDEEDVPGRWFLDLQRLQLRHLYTQQQSLTTCLEARTCLENENPCLEKSGSVLQFYKHIYALLHKYPV